MSKVTGPSSVAGSSKRHALLVLICTSFMLKLDANIVSVSLPAIAGSLNASFAGIEWVITACMLSFASLLLPAGALADRSQAVADGRPVRRLREDSRYSEMIIEKNRCRRLNYAGNFHLDKFG